MQRAALIAVGAAVGVALVMQADPVAELVADTWTEWNMTNLQALQHPNVAAMLALIRTGEGTADAGGYSRLVGGGSFDSYADHPRKRVWISAIKDYSTAAGAYQFLSKTWDEVKRKAGLSDFSPASQDLAAVQKIRDRGALSDVIAGRLDAALAKLSYEWASLPPWRYSKQGTITRDRAFALFEQFEGTLTA